MTYNTKRLFLFLFLFFVSFPARANYLGDFPEDATVNFMWTTNGSDGESITRSTDGSIWIWRDASTTSTVGITNTEDFNGMIGTHKCVIDLSADVFYATGSEYQVTIRGAVVDSKSVNAILRQFSIENRFMRGTDSALLAANYETERGTDSALLAANYETERGTDSALLATNYEVERGTDDAATAASLSTHDGKLDAVDAVVDTILLDTAALDIRLTAVRAGYLEKLNVSGTLAHSDMASTYKANVSALALETTAQSILTDTDDLQGNQGNWATATGFATSGALSTHDGKLDAVQAVTDNLPESGALTTIGVDAATMTDWIDGGRLDLILDATATGASLATVDANVDAILVTTNKLDDTLQDNAGTYEFSIPALANAPSGTGSTPAQIWGHTPRTVTGFYATGIYTWTAEVKKSGIPLVDATVWATAANAEGETQPNPHANILYSARTDANGLADLFVPAGTMNVYVWAAGANFSTSPHRITKP